MCKNILILMMLIGSTISVSAQETPYDKRMKELKAQAYMKLGTTEELLLFEAKKMSPEELIAWTITIGAIKDECTAIIKSVEKLTHKRVQDPASFCTWYKNEKAKADKLSGSPANPTAAQIEAAQKKKQEEEQEKTREKMAEFFKTNEGGIQTSVRDDFAKWMIRGEFEPQADYNQRLKDSSLIVFRRIYGNTVQNWIQWRANSMRLEGILTYDTETEIFSVSIADKGNYYDTLKSFINIPLSKAQKFKELWTELEGGYYVVDWCFVGRKLFPQTIYRTVDEEMRTFPIQQICHGRTYNKHEDVYKPIIFTPKDFKEIALAFNSLKIDNEYLRDVVLQYSDIEEQRKQERRSEEQRKEAERLAEEQRKEAERLAEEQRKEEERLAKERLAEEEKKKVEQEYGDIVNNPENTKLIVSLVNKYTSSGKDLNYIIPLIQKAQEKKPTNVSLYEIEGTLHEFLDDTESAAKCYRKITEIKPKDFFGYYKMGVLYFNKGAQYSQIVVNAKDDKEYHGLLDFADSLLKKALPFLEKAYELNPREITTVQALKEIYYRFRMENDTYRKNDEKYTRLLNEHENKSNKSNKSSGSLLDKFLDNIDDIIK